MRRTNNCSSLTSSANNNLLTPEQVSPLVHMVKRSCDSMHKVSLQLHNCFNFLCSCGCGTSLLRRLPRSRTGYQSSSTASSMLSTTDSGAANHRKS